jgi:NitT/TauT family transport system permease protein
MRRLPFFLLLFALGLLWETLAAFNLIERNLFPPPHTVIGALAESSEEWREALLSTARNSVLGLSLSLLLGSVLALLLTLFPIFKRAFLPLAVFFQTVPIIAIAPLLVIYFGFGDPTVVASSCIVSIFPVLASFLIGLENIEREKFELFQLYGATRLQTLFKLQLPGAFVALYAGLKVAVGLSIIGTIAGEFVAGGGLGSLIDASRTQQRVDRVFAALLLLSLLGMIGLLSLRLIFKAIHRIRPYGAHSQEFQ